MRSRVAAVVAVVAIAALLLHARALWLRAATALPGTAALGEPAIAVPGGLAKTARTRVVLIDGLRGDVARTLPAWRTLCARGAAVDVDVGFPTVSLPVEVALWTGLTQQQTGVVDNGDERALAPTLAARGIASIPAQVAGSRAVAEDHAWIAGSLGFDRLDDGLGTASAAVASDAALVFVHVLRVDAAGHRSGADSAAYRDAARSADELLGKLVAAAPDARWFALSDHGHLPGGGHGGEELAIRRVAACIAGPGVARAGGDADTGSAGPVRAIDIARAIADSTGARVDARSHALPLATAVASASGIAPLPAADTVDATLAWLVLAAGVLLTALAAGRRPWLWPWWLPVAAIAAAIVRGLPTLSMPSTFAPLGLGVVAPWLPALAVVAVTAYAGTRAVGPVRVAYAQLAVPAFTAAACVTACGGWHALLGGDVAAVVPRYTAYAATLMVMAACAAVVVALALLATLVPRASDRPGRPGTARKRP
jgi:hypothetical protein